LISPSLEQRITSTVHVVSLKISPSAILHIREHTSSLLSSVLTRKASAFICVGANLRPKHRSVMGPHARKFLVESHLPRHKPH
jgi:hypothetical protein